MQSMKLEIQMRLKDANRFTLVGALEDEDDELFLIGNGTAIYTAEKDVNRYLFANDMLSKYGENDGSFEVKITRKI